MVGAAPHVGASLGVLGLFFVDLFYLGVQDLQRKVDSGLRHPRRRLGRRPDRTKQRPDIARTLPDSLVDVHTGAHVIARRDASRRHPVVDAESAALHRSAMVSPVVVVGVPSRTTKYYYYYYRDLRLVSYSPLASS